MALAGKAETNGDIGEIDSLLFERSLCQVDASALDKFVGRTTDSQPQQPGKTVDAIP
jgi:hypothetical protein